MKLFTRPKALSTLPKVAIVWSTLWLLACSAPASSGKKGPQVGDAPPALALREVVQGPAVGELTWQNLHGKVVVLEFWDTRCGPCIQAIPHLNNLVDQFSSKPVIFLGISDDNRDVLKAFLKRKPIKGWLALEQPFSPTQAAFDVMGIPHTVIINAAGKIAAITHPMMLDSSHLQEILEGKPSTLPEIEPDLPEVQRSTVPVAPSSPTSVEISIQGPFPQPDGAFNACSWTKPDYRFTAKKAYLRDALGSFFGLSPYLVVERAKLPEGLYDISAVAPPDRLPELKAQLAETLSKKWGIIVRSQTQEVQAYALAVYATNAPGLKATSTRGGGGGRLGGFYLKGVPLKTVASYLENLLDRPVVDETGLTGLWAVDINWELSQSELKGAPAAPAKVIKAVREQLGLELKPEKRQLPVLVVERHPLE